MLESASLNPEEVRSMPDSHPLAPLIDAMQASLAAYLRLFAALPGIVLKERKEVGWFVGAAGPPAREVLWTRFDEATCNDQIDSVLGEIGAYCQRLDWAVYRTCRPSDLGRRMEAKGMKPGSVTWMLADLGDIRMLPPAEPDFRVEFVTTADQMQIWWHVSASGYQSTIENTKVYHDAYLSHPFGPQEDCVHYIGYWRDEPVTSATLLLAGGIAGLYAISTPPAYRRRGFGSAITRAALDTARQRGYRHACLMSSPMGKSVYQRVGFNVQVNVPEYAWTKTD